MRGILLVFSITTAAFLTLLALLLQTHVDSFTGIGVYGLFVPDTVGLRETTIAYWDREIGENSWSNLRTLFGVVLLYAPAKWIGAWGAALVNASLLVISNFIFFETVKIFLSNRKQALSISILVFLLVAGNIYLIEVMMFPNKEIPLIALTNIFLYYLLIRKNISGALVVAAGAFLFRDGYGLILMASAIFVWITWRIPKDFIGLILVGLSLVLAFFPASYLAQIDYSFQRNVEIGPLLEQRYAELIDGPTGYYVKVLGNAFNLGLRPQIFYDAGGIFLLHIGYWQLGICIVAGVLWALFRAEKSNEVEKNLASVILVVLLMISYSSYVQPRYLMPLVFWLGLALVRSALCRQIAIVMCIVSPLLFSALDMLPPKAKGVTEVNWEWPDN